MTDDELSNQRGKGFERSVREIVSDAIKNNEAFLDADCCSTAVSVKGGEEIDLLARVGSLWIVGELKCLGYPAESIERYNHRKKIAEAAAQAKRKASWLRTNADRIERFWQVPCGKPAEILPLVVQSQSQCVGLAVDGVAVVDVPILELVLFSGKYVRTAMVSVETGRSIRQEETTYSTQEEAVAAIPKLLKEPTMVTRFTDNIRWQDLSAPTTTRDVRQRVATVASDADSRRRQNDMIMDFGADEDVQRWLAGKD